MLAYSAATRLSLLDAIKLDLGPNRVAVPIPTRRLLYVGYGGKDAVRTTAKSGIIDAQTDKHLGDIKV